MRTPRAVKKNDGTGLQVKIQSALKEREAGSPAFFHRFYDTKSAFAKVLPNQPGDFMMLVPGGAVLIEAKSTEAGQTLKQLMDDAQVGKHRLWHRAGHPSLFVYEDIEARQVEIHNGTEVASRVLGRPSGLSLLERGSKADLPALLSKAIDKVTIQRANR